MVSLTGITLYHGTRAAFTGLPALPAMFTPHVIAANYYASEQHERRRGTLRVVSAMVLADAHPFLSAKSWKGIAALLGCSVDREAIDAALLRQGWAGWAMKGSRGVEAVTVVRPGTLVEVPAPRGRASRRVARRLPSRRLQLNQAGVPTLDAYLAGALPNPKALGFHRFDDFLRLPHVWYPEDLWWHGTPFEFEQFTYVGNKRVGGGLWAHMGAHFTSDYSVADQFAQGEFGRRVKTTTPRTIAARLLMSNPLRFESEVAMAEDIVAFTSPKGTRHDPWDEIFTWKGARAANRVRKYMAVVRERYDGIVYGNSSEGGFRHPCVIAHPDQIEIVSTPREPHVVMVVRAWLTGESIPASEVARYRLDRADREDIGKSLATWDRYSRGARPGLSTLLR